MKEGWIGFPGRFAIGEWSSAAYLRCYESALPGRFVVSGLISRAGGLKFARGVDWISRRVCVSCRCFIFILCASLCTWWIGLPGGFEVASIELNIDSNLAFCDFLFGPDFFFGALYIRNIKEITLCSTMLR